MRLWEALFQKYSSQLFSEMSSSKTFGESETITSHEIRIAEFITILYVLNNSGW